jgi:hypothetical protein
MSSFFERPILNSPYDYPGRHWELDAEGAPHQFKHRDSPALGASLTASESFSARWSCEGNCAAWTSRQGLDETGDQTNPDCLPCVLQSPFERVLEVLALNQPNASLKMNLMKHVSVVCECHLV